MRPIIAIIEDNYDNLELIQLSLTYSLNIPPTFAGASGAMFFRWLDTSPTTKNNPNLREVTVILLDIQIPREDGFSVHQKIRQHPSLKNTKVIAVTANIQEEIVQRAKNEGFDGFIGKPLNTEKFPDQLNRILAGQKVWEPS